MRGEQGHFGRSMECAAQVFSLEIVVKNILRGVKTSVSFICLENAHDGVDCNAVVIGNQNKSLMCVCVCVLVSFISFTFYFVLHSFF